MIVATGVTVFETVLSLDIELTPISSATFDTQVYQDGLISTGVTVNMTLLDPSTGAFVSSWSASTTGTYQVYYKNLSTNLIYITDLYQVTQFGDTPTIYVGL